MAIKIIKGDITKLAVDAIVNAANESLLGGGGVDGAIHAAAGPKLLEECRTLGGCKTGEAKITKGYKLPAKYVIHTVGPVWSGGGHGEEALLKNCFVNSLNLAKEHKLETIAFPLISSGVYGYPKAAAIRVAMDSFEEFLKTNDMDISLVIYDGKTFELSEKLYSAIEKYIGENYVDEYVPDRRREEMARRSCAPMPHTFASIAPSAFEYAETEREIPKMSAAKKEKVIPKKRSLAELIKERDETFSESLLRLIDQKGMTDVEVYKRANIDRKLFSKIRSDKDYKPSKVTAVALAVALGLSLDETLDLIGRAGFTLSMSAKFDLIIRYFLDEGNHKIYEINEALFAFDQAMLGV